MYANATVADPVALDPVPEQTADELQNQFRAGRCRKSAADTWPYDEPGEAYSVC